MAASRSIGLGALLAAAAVVLAHVSVAALFLLEDAPGTSAALWGFPLDDAWIHLVYARSLATHGVPAYNATIEAGFTSPLWMLLLSVAELASRLTGASIVLLAKGLGVLSAVAASLGVLALARALGAGLLLATLAALLVALDPHMAFAQVSGMEVPLAAACAVWALERLVAGAPRATGLLLAAAALARPEWALLVVLVAALLAWQGRTWALVHALWPSVVAALAWVALCLAATGHPLPNTFYAKAQPGELKGLFVVFGDVVLAAPLFASVAGGLAWAAGAVALVRRQRLLGALVLAVPWLFVAAVALSRRMPESAGVYFYFWRYPLPALPLLVVPWAVGLSALLRGEGPLFARLPSLGARRAIAALMMLATFALVPAGLADRAEQLAWNAQNIEEVQVAMGRLIAERTPEGATVLVNDAGAIRYFGGRRTIDLIGLNSHEVLFDTPPELRTAARAGVPGMLRLMDRFGAEVAVVFPSWAPGLFTDPALQQAFEPLGWLRSEHYTVSGGRQDLMVALRRAARR